MMNFVQVQNSKSLLIPWSSTDSLICPVQMFNVTDPLCQGQVPYNYYTCHQIATSTSVTIQFGLQHGTVSGHWYFDDISVTQNNNIQLIINGGFESNLTGWILNISSNSTRETYVDSMSGLAHTGSAYLYGASRNSPAYIQQTFNVTQGEYINVSFWWGYDGGLHSGHVCEAIGQLLPSL